MGFPGVHTWDSPLQSHRGVISPVSPLPNMPHSILCISFISCSVLANLCWISPASDKGQNTYRGDDPWISTSCRVAMSKSGHSYPILLFSCHASFLFSGFLFFFIEVLDVKRTLLHTWDLEPAVVLLGFVSIIIHRKARFFLILLNDFWLIELEHSGRWAFGVDDRKKVSPVFHLHWVPIIRSPQTRLHPPIAASTNFPVPLLNCFAPMLQSAIWIHWLCLAGCVASWSKWQSHIRKACILTDGETTGFSSVNWGIISAILCFSPAWLFIPPCCLISMFPHYLESIHRFSSFLIWIHSIW